MERHHYLSENLLQGTKADITFVDAAGNVYIGNFERTFFDGNLDTVFDQPIWQIIKTEIMTNEDGSQEIRTLYPNGNCQFCHRWSDLRNIKFNFKLA